MPNSYPSVARLAELQAQIDDVLRDLGRLRPGRAEHEAMVQERYPPLLRDTLALGDELTDQQSESPDPTKWAACPGDAKAARGCDCREALPAGSDPSRR